MSKVQEHTTKNAIFNEMNNNLSNIISTAFSGNAKNLDVGGLIITITRLFSDTKFIARLEHEYINSGLSEIYEREYSDISLYY